MIVVSHERRWLTRPVDPTSSIEKAKCKSQLGDSVRAETPESKKNVENRHTDARAHWLMDVEEGRWSGEWGNLLAGGTIAFAHHCIIVPP